MVMGQTRFNGVAEAADGGVKVTMPSMFSGKIHSTVFRMSVAEFEEAVERWNGGELIQRAFPTLNADQREFLMTGSTPEEWSEAFPPEDE